MARDIPLIPGATYYAGADLPFYVSRSMVSGYLEGRGFTNIRWHDRDEALPASLDPQRDPQYSDDWTEWAEATYRGSGSGVLAPPASPAWLRVELPATTGQTPPAATPGTPLGQLSSTASSPVAPASIVDPVIVREKRLGVAATVVGGALVLGGLFWSLRQRRRELYEVQPDEPATSKAPPAKRR